MIENANIIKFIAIACNFLSSPRTKTPDDNTMPLIISGEFCAPNLTMEYFEQNPEILVSMAKRQAEIMPHEPQAIIPVDLYSGPNGQSIDFAFIDVETFRKVYADHDVDSVVAFFIKNSKSIVDKIFSGVNHGS